MELNSAVWGSENDQLLQTNVYTNHISVSNVVPNIGAYKQQYTMSEPIENSIALWQMGDQSWFNKQRFLRRDGNNIIQVNDRTTVNSKSLWLCVPVSFGTGNVLHFNPAQYQCNIWDPDNTSAFYNNSANSGIITGFNYNRLVLRHRCCCRAYNSETGVHSGNVRFLSVYEYFYGIDTDSVPFREKYCIESITVVVGSSTGDNPPTGTTPHLVSLNVTLTTPNSVTGNAAHIYTNTPYNTPSPANNYYKSTYTYYAQCADIIGLQLARKTTIPQQAVFADNNAYYIDGFSADKWSMDEFRDSGIDYVATRFTGTYDDIMEQLALFGFWFADDDNFGQTQIITGRDCNSDHVCLPEIIGGRTTGNYKRGVVAGADPQATWDNNWRDSVGYNGDKPYKNAQNDTGDLTSIFNRTFIGGSCKYYTMIGIDLRDLVSAINSGYQPTDNDQFVLDFKGSNPADYISSCLYYPDGFTCADRSTDNIPLKIGALELAVTAHEADINAENIVSFSPVTIPALFGDFRDYSPYTSLDLYIPFCGSVELDPAVFVGHTIQVYLFIDFPTGNCTGVVMRDSLVYDTVNGTCGVSIPLTAQNVGQYQNAIKSAEIALKQAEMQRKTAWLAAAGSGVTLIAGVGTANPLAIAGGAGGLIGSFGPSGNIERANLSVESAEYNLTHTAPSVRSLSTASPANALQMDYDCHLIIKRATMSDGYDETIYSHTIGNACAINDVLSAFHGLTVCADANLSGIPCTADEKQQIMQMLKSGVYI